MKFVLEKLIEYLRKLTQILLVYRLINYFATGNLLCDQIMYQKNFENKNHDINENFQAKIKFGAYIFLR